MSTPTRCSGFETFTSCNDLTNATIEDLGSAKRIAITKENSTIIDGAGDVKAIKERIEQIRAEIDASSSDYDREKSQERLAKLAGGSPVAAL